MIVWRKGQFNDEITEMRRICEEFAGDPKNKKEVDSLIEELKKIYGRSSPQTLTDSVWRILQNSGSWNVRSMDDVKRNLKKDGVTRDVSRIQSQYRNGRADCPIILMAPGNKPYHYNLVAGNTRLSAARAMGIRPKVIILETDW